MTPSNPDPPDLREGPAVLTAGWLLPVEGPPLREGALVAEGGRLAWVGSAAELPAAYRTAPRFDYPAGILLPGLVNAHCHLHLAGLRGRLTPGGDFTAWIRELLAATAAWTPADHERHTRAALRELAADGTTTVAHVGPDPALNAFAESPLRAVVFHEFLGFPEAWAAERLAAARAWLAEAAAALPRGRVRPGLAAHAPYSTSAGLLRGLAELARERGVPFSVHLAETPAEARFLARGDGPFRTLLRERGAWDEAWRPPGCSPVALAEALGLLETPGVAVHLNELAPDDPARLRRGRLTPCWCPGTHAWFRRQLPADAGTLPAAGVPLALGTDSPASNEALAMRRELRLAAAAHPERPPGDWLRAATLTGAEALGLGSETGSLRAGKAADLLLLDAAAATETDPNRALLSEQVRVRFVWVAGWPVRIDPDV